MRRLPPSRRKARTTRLAFVFGFVKVLKNLRFLHGLAKIEFRGTQPSALFVSRDLSLMFDQGQRKLRSKYALRNLPVAFEILERRLVLDSTVVFNEIMCHPQEEEDSLEWIELYNQMAIDMDISGWSLAGGIDYQFATGTMIDGHGYLVVAKNPTELSSQTGFDEALGPFTGRLSNGGEEIQLINNSQRTMNVVDYRDRGDWPVGPDGSGHTLAKREADLASHDFGN